MILFSAIVETAPESDLLGQVLEAYKNDATGTHVLRTATSDAVNPAYRVISGFLFFIDGGRYRLYVPDVQRH
jgi:hypothetical protein